MYTVHVEYQIGDEIKTASHKAVSYLDHIAMTHQQCSAMIPYETDVSIYEDIILKQGHINRISLFNENGEELYASTRWTKVKYIQKSFEKEGQIHREVVFEL